MGFMFNNWIKEVDVLGPGFVTLKWECFEGGNDSHNQSAGGTG